MNSKTFYARYGSRVVKYIQQKVYPLCEKIFHVYLMRGLQKYARNCNLMVAFWATCNIGQPIWQQLFALKKPSLELNFLPSPCQVGMKNSVKYWKYFLLYFTTLETYCEVSKIFIPDRHDYCDRSLCLQNFLRSFQSQLLP
jgi:hypothetical protein